MTSKQWLNEAEPLLTAKMDTWASNCSSKSYICVCTQLSSESKRSLLAIEDDDEDDVNGMMQGGASRQEVVEARAVGGL